MYSIKTTFGVASAEQRPGGLSRRTLMQFLLAGVALPLGLRPASAVAEESIARAIAGAKVVKRFTQAGAGDLDGSTWSNAMPIGWLSKSLALAEPKTALLIGVDAGREKAIPFSRAQQIFVKTSGAADAPIFVLAGNVAGDADLAPAGGLDGSPLFAGSPAWTLETFGKLKGPPCFIAIQNSASHLVFSGFSVTGTSGDGFIKFRVGKGGSATFDAVQISGISATLVGRVIETDRNAVLTNFLVEDCTARGIIRGFGRFRDISHATFRRLDLDADNMDAGGKNVCQLIAIASGEDILFEDVTLKNAVSTKKSADGKTKGYVQGDGIVCERKTRNITFRRCHGFGMGDAAFDLKTTDVTMEGCTTDQCKFGARIWTASNNVIRDCSFSNPAIQGGGTSGACIQASGTLEIVDTKLQAGKGASAIVLHTLPGGKPPAVRMRGGSIQLDDSAALATANGQGTLELTDVTVNGEKRTTTYQLDKNLIR